MSQSTTPTAASMDLEARIDHLMIAIESILRQHPEGISELALIKQLQTTPWTLLGTVNFQEPAQLYPVHFLIYHAVYRIRDALSEHGEIVSTSPLCLKITIDLVVSGSGTPATQDELRKYYLDLSHYELSEAVIDSLMTNFWAGHSGQLPDHSALQSAAGQLGFESLPDAFDIIKRRYRREVMATHPDRGGDTERIQQLNAAFQVLKSHFRSRGLS